MKLFRITYTSIAVSPDTDLTKAPEVIGATIQANATITAAIVGAIATLLAAILATILTKEKGKSKKLEDKLEELNKVVDSLIGEFKNLDQSDVEPNLKNTLFEISNSFTTKILEIKKDFEVWQEAYFWLEREQENLLRKAFDDTLSKLDYLQNPGRCLALSASKEQFKRSINKRLEWVRLCLKFKIIRGLDEERVKSRLTPRIIEPEAYLEAYKSIKDQIIAAKNKENRNFLNKKKSLSREGADVLHKFIDLLIEER
jgi:gas vesicle protein